MYVPYTLATSPIYKRGRNLSLNLYRKPLKNRHFLEGLLLYSHPYSKATSKADFGPLAAKYTLEGVLMTYRKRMDVRTWLDGREYDLLSSSTVLHYDLFAYKDIAGHLWFAIEVRAGGVGKLAQSLFRFDPATGQLETRHATPALEPVTWGRATNHVFRRVHGALLALCGAVPGYNRRSVHCHYVPVPDCDPWPRGTVNTFHYGGRVGGTGQGKPQRVRRQPRDCTNPPHPDAANGFDFTNVPTIEELAATLGKPLPDLL